ncbi:MAG: M48 family metalloprotease [Pseudomonadota bacterium]
MARFLSIFFIFIVLFNFNPDKALSNGLVRDTEIENTLRYFINPLIKKSDLIEKQISTHLIINPSLNAFVTGGQNIFLYSGLVSATDQPEELIGVIAHELGHIASGHLALFQDDIDRAKNIGLLSAAIAVPLAILSGSGGAVAGSLAGSSGAAQRSFFSHSREKEFAADQFALSLLNRSGYNMNGFLTFMQKLSQRERLYGSGDSYLRTHPLTKEREKAIESYIELNQKDNPQQPEKETIDYLYQRMRAKIIGYTMPYQQVLRRYGQTSQSESALYARTFAYFQDENMPKALAEIDVLLAKRPDDPFYLETKADILFKMARFDEALAIYQHILKTIPWATLIHVSLARTMLQQSKDKDSLEEVVQILRKTVIQDPALISAWKQLAIAYGRLNQPALSHLAQAEEALLTNNPKYALALAEKSIQNLPRGSAAWQRARDLIKQSRQLLSAS